MLTPDMPSRGRSLAQAAREGTESLVRTVRGLSGQRDLFRFLLANMIYADGLVALFAFGGIYAAGTFGWHTTEIGIFGILLTITGTVGALAGGRLDDLFGPRAVVSGSLVLLIVAVLGILGTTRDAVLFAVPVAPPVAGDGLFAATSERAYLALGLLIGIVAGPLQAASRTLLVRLAPPGDIGQCFGLFALSGKVTSFLGPTLVAVLTGLTGSQRAGVAVLLAFFAAGLVLIRSLSAGSGDTR
jgi:UMF1 family MFS transporter